MKYLGQFLAILLTSPFWIPLGAFASILALAVLSIAFLVSLLLYAVSREWVGPMELLGSDGFD